MLSLGSYSFNLVLTIAISALICAVVLRMTVAQRRFAKRNTFGGARYKNYATFVGSQFADFLALLFARFLFLVAFLAGLVAAAKHLNLLP